MKLRNRTTHFSSLPEGAPPPNPKKRFTARLYFFVLFAVVAYLAYYGVMQLLYIETRGQVEVGRALIYAGTGGIIQEIHVQPGQAVEAGRLLATIIPPQKNPPSLAKDLLKAQEESAETAAELGRLRDMLAALEAVAGDGAATAGALPKSILKIDNDIRLQKVALVRLEGRRKLTADILRQREERAARQRLLELSRDNPKEDEPLRRELVELEAGVAGAAQELRALQQYRADELQAETEDMRRRAAALADTLKHREAYLAGLRAEGEVSLTVAERLTAPAGGSVQAIFRLTGEQANPGEAILALQTPEAQVAVRGYFSEDQLVHLEKNKRVTVLFPDHSSGEGVIRNHYSIAASYREAIKDKYIPVESTMLAEIMPADSAAEGTWRKFDRMDVRIRVKR